MARDINLGNIDLNLLIVFEAIYSAGSVTRAAQKLNMTQPTLSNALARLRQQIGDPLFQRTDKGVAPTPFADNFISPVRQALSILREGVSINRDFDPTSATRIFRVALNDFTVISLMPALLDEVVRHAPGIKLVVLGHTTNAPLDALLTGEADLVVDTFPQDVQGVDLEPIHIPAAKVVVRRDHPHIRGSITKEQYCAAAHVGLLMEDQMRKTVEAGLLLQGVRRRMVCEVTNCLQIPALVAATDLVSMLPSLYARHAARYYGLQVLTPPFRLALTRGQIATLSEKSSDTGLAWLRQRLLHAARREAVDESWEDDRG